MKKKLTILQPNLVLGNEYVAIIKQIIHELGYETISAKESIKKELFSKIEIANFSWYENCKVRKPYCIKLQILADIVTKILFILFLKKIKKTKIIFTLHNKFDHNLLYKKYSLFLLKWMCMNGDKIIILCEETKVYLREIFDAKDYCDIEKKCNLIPHPNYIGVYPFENINDYYKIPKDQKLNLLFFGLIKEYKNIELIIKLSYELEKLDIRFIIAGSGEAEYIEKIRSKIINIKNIIFIPEYIPDNKISQLISNSDIVIFPYNKESVLNSGACILALSLNKNVIIPNIGTVKDFPDKLAYIYDYENDEKHFHVLKKVVCEAYNDFKYNPEKFYSRQNRIFNYIRDTNSREQVKSKYQQLYLQLEKGNERT